MSVTISSSLKRQFKEGFDEYIRKIGRSILLELPPYEVTCPNCVWDSVNLRSSNVWCSTFLRPVNVFPGTSCQQTVYPHPFNVLSASGVTYDPAEPNPRILYCKVCPVCYGSGKILCENKACITAVVDWNIVGNDGEYKQLAAGTLGSPYARLKTYTYNIALVTKAVHFIVDGIRCVPSKVVTPKGIGAEHLVEVWVSSEENSNLADMLNQNQPGLVVQPLAQISNQASPSTPTIPPVVAGDDVW